MKSSPITLIHPDLYQAHGGPSLQRAWPPLDLANLAGMLRRRGWAPTILDLAARPIGLDQVARGLARDQWVVVSTGAIDRWQCPPLDITPVFRIVDRALERTTPDRVVVIGPHTLFASVEPLRRRGVVIAEGEPEARFRDFAPGSSAEVLLAPPPLDFPLDEMGVPALDLLDFSRYSHFLLGRPFAVLETSRGCRRACTYCFKDMFGAKVRFKSVDRVIEEVEQLRRLGVRSFEFTELDFLGSRPRAVEICERILGSGWKLRWSCDLNLLDVDAELIRLMKRSGCAFVQFGVESARPADVSGGERNKGDIDLMRGKVRMMAEAGMVTVAYVRFGHLGETEQDMERTTEVVCGLSLDFASFDLVVPYPGTALHRAVRGELKAFSPSGLSLANDSVVPLERLNRYVGRAYRRFYLRPRYVLSRLHLLGRAPGLWEGLGAVIRKARAER